LALHIAFLCIALLTSGLLYLFIPTLSLWWLLLLLPGGYLAAVLVYILAILVIPAIFMPKGEECPHRPLYRHVAYYTLDWVTRLLGYSVRLTGGDKLPREPFLLVSNHRSGFDPIVTIPALKNRHYLTFVAKPEVLRIPVIGTVMRNASFLSIDRENPRRAVETIRRAASYITERRLSIGIYPEGTRNREDGLLPFHNGVFKVAKQAKCPIAVVTIRYLPRTWCFGAKPVQLTVAGVLDSEFVAASPNAVIGDRVRSVMEERLNEER